VLIALGEPLECGAEHPARKSIRCTAESGHPQEYHRNSVLRIEWQGEGCEEVTTWVDGLGFMVFPPLPPDRYFRLPPEGSKVCSQFVLPEGSLCTLPLGHDGDCGEPPTEEAAAADREYWDPGDTIPLHVDRVETSTNFMWSRARGREGQDLGYFQLVACPVLPGEDVLAIFGPVTQVDDEPDTDPDADSPEVLVYRTLIPILDRAGEKLRRVQRSYKGAATKGVEQAARDCEQAVQQLEKLVDPDPGGDRDA
jgi:hypothetical protein